VRVKVCCQEVKSECLKCGERFESSNKRFTDYSYDDSPLTEAKGDQKYIKCSLSCKDCSKQPQNSFQDTSCSICSLPFRYLVDRRIKDKPSAAGKAHYMLELISEDGTVGICLPC
jgi:hypothetical protein